MTIDRRRFVEVTSDLLLSTLSRSRSQLADASWKVFDLLFKFIAQTTVLSIGAWITLLSTKTISAGGSTRACDALLVVLPLLFHVGTLVLACLILWISYRSVRARAWSFSNSAAPVERWATSFLSMELLGQLNESTGTANLEAELKNASIVLGRFEDQDKISLESAKKDSDTAHSLGRVCVFTFLLSIAVSTAAITYLVTSPH